MCQENQGVRIPYLKFYSTQMIWQILQSRALPATVKNAGLPGPGKLREHG